MEWCDDDFDEIHGTPFRAARVPRRFRVGPSSLRQILFAEGHESDAFDEESSSASPGAGPSSTSTSSPNSPLPLPTEDERAQEAHWIARIYGLKPREAIVEEYERGPDPWVRRRHQAILTAWANALRRIARAYYENEVFARVLDREQYGADRDRFLDTAHRIETLRIERLLNIEEKLAKLHSEIPLPSTAHPLTYVSRNPLASSRRLLPDDEYPVSTPKDWQAFMTAFEYDYIGYIEECGMPCDEQILVDLSRSGEPGCSVMTMSLRQARHDILEWQASTCDADEAPGTVEGRQVGKDDEEKEQDGGEKEQEDEEDGDEEGNWQLYVERDFCTPFASRTPSSSTSELEASSDDEEFTMSPMKRPPPELYEFDRHRIMEDEEDEEDNYIPILETRFESREEELELCHEDEAEGLMSRQGPALGWHYREMLQGRSSPPVMFQSGSGFMGNVGENGLSDDLDWLISRVRGLELEEDD